MKDHNTLRTFAVATLLLAGTLHAQHTRTGKGESYWNNTWEWHHHLEHQFDAQGQEVLYTHYSVSVLDSSMTMESITHKGYSGSGQLVWRSTRSADPFTQLLTVGDSTVFVHDAQDSLLTETMYTLDGGSWELSTRTTYYRNVIGALDSAYVDTDAFGNWNLAARMLITLNAQGWTEHIQYDSLLNNVWIEYAELEIAYDPDGRPTLYEYTDPTPIPYEGVRHAFSYDAQGQLDSLVHSTKFPGGSWHSYSCTTYDPVGDGLSNYSNYYRLDTLSIDWTLNDRLTYEPFTAIPERPTAAVLRAFPNPTEDVVRIPELTGTPVRIQVCDGHGRVALEQSLVMDGTISLAGLPAGSYHLVTTDPRGGVRFTRVLKH